MNIRRSKLRTAVLWGFLCGIGYIIISHLLLSLLAIDERTFIALDIVSGLVLIAVAMTPLFILLRRENQARRQMELSLRDSEALFREERELSQLARQQNETFYRLIIEAVSELIVVLNNDLIITYVSPSVEAVLGYRPGEVMGSKGLEFVHPDDVPTVAPILLNALEHPGALDCAIFRLKHKSGGWRKVESIGRGVGIGQPPVTSVIISTRDISERERVEGERRKTEALYRVLVEQIPAITYVVAFGDVNRTTFISPQIESVLGFSPEEWLADPELWSRQIHPEDRERVLAEVANRDAAGEPLDIEYRALSRDGRLVWIRNTSTLIRGNDHVRLAQGLMRDVTDRKQMELQLRDAEAKYRTLVEQSLIGVYLIVDDRFVYMNEAAANVFGYQADEVIERMGPSDLVHPADLDLVQANIQRRLSGEIDVLRYRLRGLRKDGATIHCDVVGRRILYQGRPAILGTLLDITEREQRQRELEVLSVVSAALREAPTRENMLPIILDQTLQLLGAEGAALVTLDPTTEETVIELGRGQWAGVTGLRIPRGEGVSSQVIATRQPCLNNDTQAAPSLFWPHLRGGMPAAACAPIAAETQCLGALWIGRSAGFADEDVRLLAAIGALAGNAMRRATLYEETLRHGKQQATVSILGRAMAETLDLPQIYDRLYDAVFDLLPNVFDGMHIGLIDPGQQFIQCVYAVKDGLRIGAASLPPIPLDPPGAGIQNDVIHNRQPVNIGDVNAEADNRKLDVVIHLPDGATRSALFLPMLSRNRVIGVMQIQSYIARHFTSADMDLLSFAANAAAVAIENARLFAETRRRLDNVEALRAIDMAITSSLDLRIPLTVVLDQSIKHLGVDAAAVLTLNPQAHVLEYYTGRGFRLHDIERRRLRLGEGYAGRAALERRTVFIPDLSRAAEPFERLSLVAGENFIAYYAMPLIAKGQVKGVLEVYRRDSLSPNSEWISFMEGVAAQAAIAIDNAGMFTSLQQTNTELMLAYETTLEGWSLALDLRDHETEGHTQRVTELTVRLARRMGLSESELVHMRRGALLHDIGKMGIPDSILHKAGPLTDAEREIMRQHPQYARDLLSEIRFLHPALDIPYCHHEKWDGSGYPRGLKGEHIPLSARIFAVADVWDALSSDRPYRKAWPRGEVINYLRDQSGRHFDPRVIHLFLEIESEWDEEEAAKKRVRSTVPE